MTETISATKAPVAAAAIVTGLGLAWAVPSRVAALAVLAVGLAAANGYSKAYSP